MKEFVEKLIGRLEEEIIYDTFDHYKEEPLINMSFERLEDIINELAEKYSADTPQKSANGWIPCSERLPKRNTNVIAQFSSGVVSELLFNEKGLFQGIYEYGPNVIIAWQPLPEPYKPQKTEWKNKVMKHFTNVE